MTFMKQNSPLVLTSENAFKRLIIYHIATWFMVLTALVIQGVLGIEYFVFGLAQIMTAILVTLFFVMLQSITLHKEHPITFKNIYRPLTYGLLAALLLPTQAPLYMLGIAIVIIHVTEFIFKKLFNKNIMHPVLLSILIVQLVFRDQFEVSETMSNIFQSETLTLGRLRLFFGAYEGLTLGTTAFIILGLLWIYMSISKIVDYRVGLWYLLHLSIFVVSLTLFTDYAFLPLFAQLMLGYALLTLVFFIGEPTASPETPEMRIIFPFITVLLAVILRLQYDIIEAPLYAVVFAQFLTWGFEQIYHRTTKLRLRIAHSFIIVVWIIVLVNIIWFR